MKVTIEIEVPIAPVRGDRENGPAVEDIMLDITKDELEKLVLDAVWDQHGDDIEAKVWEEA